MATASTPAPTDGRNFGIDAALAEAEATYAAANPASRAAMDRAAEHLPGGNTRTVIWYPPFPLFAARSEGAHLFDLDGHEYLDFLGEYTAGLFGHSDPTIKRAILAAVERGWANGMHAEAEGRLAALICARIPSLERVRFCNSGTEANLLALTTARAFSGRERVMVFRGGYHGGVLLFKSGGSPQNVPFLLAVETYNDPEAAAAAIAREGAALAAVLLEPMQGSSGCIPATRAFLLAVRDACTATGALLIFDEVMTSRLGPAGLQGEHGIRPDLTTLGKYMGGGLSFGAFGGRADIMDRFDPRHPAHFVHAGTFNNNPFTMAAGNAAMGEVFTPDEAVRLTASGNALRARLNTAAATRGLAVHASGFGSMMNIHFVQGPITTVDDAEISDPRLHALLHIDLLNRGIHIARRGMVNLSLPMTAADLGRLLAAFEAFLDDHAALLPRRRAA